MPTRKAVYDTKARQKAQQTSSAQQGRQADKLKEFDTWLKTTGYRKTEKFSALTQRTVFECKTCKTQREGTPFALWRTGQAPKCNTCEFDKKLPSDYKRLTPYGRRVVLKHNCGLQKEYVAGTFLRGASYCDCLKNKNFHTEESYRQAVKSSRNGEFEVEQKYVNTKTPIWHRHIGGCGKRFKQTPGMFLAGERCPACETGVKWDEQSIVATITKKFGKNYEVKRAGATVRSYWTLTHVTCGKTFKAVPEYLIHKAQTAVPCPFCQSSPGKLYEVRRQNRRFWLQGTEKLALDHVLSKGILAKSIVHGLKGVPKISYQYAGKSLNYYPDFYVEARNIIVEAKDINSFGLGAWFEERVFERNCAKAKAVISSGYRYKMLVFKQGVLIKLPPKWWKLSKKVLQKKLS